MKRRQSRWLGWLTCAIGISGCGSVTTEDNRGAPVFTVVARLESAPAAAPIGPLRATLVWLNGSPVPGTRCADLACRQTVHDQRFVTTSDIEVSTEFPLTVRLGVFEVPSPLQGLYTGTIAIPGQSFTDLVFNSLPEAELVLYEDGNGNGKLDLLQPGQPGPGPDRIVALSSGVDDTGVAHRIAVVNKRAPIAPPGPGFGEGVFGSDNLDIASFVWPPPEPLASLFPKDVTPNGKPLVTDGVYLLDVSAPASQSLVQRAVLDSHSLLGNGVSSFFLRLANLTYVPVSENVVKLYPITPDRRSWLARGCDLYPEPDSDWRILQQPPAGTDVQCGGGALAFASNPGDYCSQVRVVEAAAARLPEPSWWPCDAQGLKPGGPYHAAAQFFEASRSYAKATTDTGPTHQIPESWSCRPGVIYDWDTAPAFHQPSVAPPAGSQVRCYARDSLSFIPPHPDGCLFKFTYDLSSSTVVGLVPGVAWDQRQNPPAWWPCDEQGQLRAGTPYVAPQPLPAADCNFEYEALAPFPSDAPPSGHSRVRCDSAEQITYSPLWADACDGRTALALSGSTGSLSWFSSDAPPDYWPCDENGQFIAGKGYEAW